MLSRLCTFWNIVFFSWNQVTNFNVKKSNSRKFCKISHCVCRKSCFHAKIVKLKRTSFVFTQKSWNWVLKKPIRVCMFSQKIRYILDWCVISKVCPTFSRPNMILHSFWVAEKFQKFPCFWHIFQHTKLCKHPVIYRFPFMYESVNY